MIGMEWVALGIAAGIMAVIVGFAWASRMPYGRTCRCFLRLGWGSITGQPEGAVVALPQVVFIEFAPEGRAADPEFCCGYSFAAVVFGQYRHNLLAFYLPQRGFN